MKKHLLLLIALTVSSAAFASTIGSVGIPTQEMGIPAVDLLNNGHEIDRDEAIDLSTHGVDLSTLQPQNSDAWTNESLPISNAQQWNYPPEGARLSFDSKMDSTERVMRSRVIQGSGIASQPFQLLISLNAHRAMTTAALLRKLGYPIASPRHYDTLTITFSDIAARDEFINNLSDKNQACRGRWLKYTPANPQEAAAIAKDPCARKDYVEHSPAFLSRAEVTLQDVVLEPAQIDTWMFHWGVMRSQLLKGRRSLRALLIPILLADIQESVNLYAWEVGHIQNNYLILTHPYADQWQEATFNDLKWVARKISALTRADIAAIVSEGRYPLDVAALLVEKMIARQKQMTEIFGLAGPVNYAFNARIDAGAVKKGKATQQWYPGFAERFAYDDPQSPLRADELGRYFEINGLASGISKLVEKVNKLLEVQAVNNVGQNHIADLRQRCIDEFTRHGSCTRPMGIWGGPIANASITADRSVITGNLYGGDAKVQLVDNLGVSAMVGYFATKDGLPGIGSTPIQAGILANLTVQRNYVHVRSVASMRDALRNNWGNLYVPKFMTGLANSLDSEISVRPSASPSPSSSGTPGNVVATAIPFLDDLKEGEMFIVTDSIAIGAKAQVGLPLGAILDIGIMGLNPSISISAGAQRAILRRTTITRTSTGLQVYLQRVNQSSLNFEFNVNFWINVFKFSASGKHSIAEAKAFLLGNVADADRKKAAVALKALLKSNNSEILEGDFPYFKLNHEMTSRVSKGSFLRWQWFSLDESHEVKIQPPRDAVDVAHLINPAAFERTLYSHRLVRTDGSNDAALISSAISQVAPGWTVLPDGGVNPANSFLGKGQWGTWEVEGEVTPGHVSSPVTTVEHHWGGWKLPRDKLLRIIDGIEQSTAPLHLNIPTIRRDEFQTLRELQFYDITQKLIIYQKGMDRLRDYFFSQNKSFSVEQTDRELHKRLVALEMSDGGPRPGDFSDYCRQEGVPSSEGNWYSAFRDGGLSVVGSMNNPMGVDDGRDPQALWYLKNEFGRRDDSNDAGFYCIKPWMRSILDGYRNIPTEPRRQIQWQANFVKNLEAKIPLKKLLNLVGRDNYFYRVNISGFSDVDSSINNENGIVDYVSDSIGTASEIDAGGIFSDFANSTGITGYELNGRYMSEGM